MLDLRDVVTDLAVKAFTPTHVRNNHLILAGFTVKRTKANPDRSKTTQSTQQLEVIEQKGDLLIFDLW